MAPMPSSCSKVVAAKSNRMTLRDHQDRYQHDGSRLQYSGPSGDRERDRVIEFDQDQYAQQRSEDILQQLRIEKAHSELEIVEYIDPHHHQRIDDDDRYKKHHDVRGDSLKSLIGRQRFPVPFEHYKIQLMSRTARAHYTPMAVLSASQQNFRFGRFRTAATVRPRRWKFHQDRA